MWPWEHLAFGYVLLSLWTRARGRPELTDGTVVALAVGTQFPDLIDKSGAWVFGVLPSGISLAHSVLFAVPLAVVSILFARHRGDGHLGVGFAIGLLSHLAGDIIWPLAVGGNPPVLLWPLVSGGVDNEPFVSRVSELWLRFVEFLGTPRGALYLGVELGFLVVALALWRRDNYPGRGVFHRTWRRLRSVRADERP